MYTMITNIGYMMKWWFIRRFIVTLETCIDAYTGFQGDLYKLPFHHIRYLCHTRDEEDAASLLG